MDLREIILDYLGEPSLIIRALKSRDISQAEVRDKLAEEESRGKVLQKGRLKRFEA